MYKIFKKYLCFSLMIFLSFTAMSSSSFYLQDYDFFASNLKYERYLKSIRSFKKSLAFNDTVEDDQKKYIYSLELLESIFNILKVYYVDKETLSNEKIIKDIVNYISKKISSIKINSEKEQWRVSIKNYSFNIMKNPGNFELISELMKISYILEEVFPDELKNLSSDQTVDGARFVVTGILDALDPHSVLLNKESFQELKEGTEGVFGGLGILVGLEDFILTVVKPLPHSPAAKAGIRKFDKIVAIEGKSTYGFDLSELVSIMKGQPGTSVNLSLLSEGAMFSHDLKVNREVIVVDSVSSSIKKYMNEKFIYIKIESFSMRTSEEVKNHIDSLKAKHEENISGIILDLRDNPGGLLDQAVKVSDLFLEEGYPIVRTKGQFMDMEVSTNKIQAYKDPLLVIVNNDSASASEIVAAAMQDNKRALILGSSTFGKATVQTIFELPKDQALKLTIARYYTPYGDSIQNIGIIPDVYIQKVEMNSKNSNLLGSYRYRSEKFISNALSSDVEQHENDPVLSIFYKDSSPSGYNFDDNLDFTLETSFKVLSEVARSPKSSYEKGLREWLAKNSILKEYANINNTTVHDHLLKKYGLDWSNTHANQRRLDIQLNDVQYSKVDISPGEKVRVYFSVTNNSSQDLEGVSFFLRDQRLNYSFEEVLVGLIKSKQSIKKSFDFILPSTDETSSFVIEHGLSLKGRALLNTISKKILFLEEQADPEISTEFYLVEEEGGDVLGKLEAKEYAKLKVVVKNRGYSKLEDLVVKMVNLSGQQIEIASEIFKSTRVLYPGESDSYYFDIHGSDRLKSSVLSLGLFVNSSNMLRPKQETLNLFALPISH